MTTRGERFPPSTELTEKLTEKEYRASFVEAEIRRGLPLQIRAIREARNWNQKQLGDAAGIPQANISRTENTRDTFLSFQTLLKIAEAFDVALIVKFAPFSELEDWATRPLSSVVPLAFSAERVAQAEKSRATDEQGTHGLTLDMYYAEVSSGDRRASKGSGVLFPFGKRSKSGPTEYAPTNASHRRPI
jgi:transcriptional regulator with XRE-family HTH domain